MSQIPIRSLGEGDDQVIFFPIPADGILTLDDLRSGFPTLTSLRYTDAVDDVQHHILCRNNSFLEPDGGWVKDGRQYFAVCSSKNLENSRLALFETYRKQVTNKSQEPGTHQSREKSKEIDKTTMSVGLGRFKGDKFSKMIGNGPGCGGFVSVGPFLKTENTSEEIKTAAFTKFSQVSQQFRQKYKSKDDFYLTYPDGSLVNLLPDKSDTFSILGYRNFLDPTRRFDRLRLFLCEKANYEDHNPFEIVSTSSSDNDLPSIPPETEENQDCDNNDDTLLLTTDVYFHLDGSVLIESFPNNARGSELMSFANDCLNEPIVLKSSETGVKINSDDRLLALTTNNKLHLNVELLTSREAGLENNKEQEQISADYEETEEVADAIVKKTIDIMKGKTTDPKLILKQYQELFLQGRPLDVITEEDVIEGETSAVYVSRHSLLTDLLEEIQYMENIRFPIEVVFHGEAAQDLGGPRRELLYAANHQLKERFLKEANGNLILFRNEEDLAYRRYYFGGILIGLCIIQGGPSCEYLMAILNDTEECEVKAQLIKGLKKTGIYQLINTVPTMKYVFMHSSSSPELTVNKLLSTLTVLFSEEGSNKRLGEEKADKSFVKYVREVYAGRRGDVSLEKILKFTTGASTVPLLGFAMGPSIDFAENMYPTASTCINRLTLPLDTTPETHSRYDMAFLNDYFGLQ